MEAALAEWLKAKAVSSHILTWTAWVQLPPSPTHNTCLLCSAMSCLMKLACLISCQDRPLGRVVKGESCVQSHSDLDGVGSIPDIPNAQYVPSLLCHERFNESRLPVLSTYWYRQ